MVPPSAQNRFLDSGRTEYVVVFLTGANGCGSPRLAETDIKELGCSFKHTSNEFYEFVNYSDGRQPKDPDTLKFVRTHVMRNHRRQPYITGHIRHGIQGVETDRQDNIAAATADLERHLILPLEHWNRDPFDSFPLKMTPHMHDLLYHYVSAVADYLYPIEAYWGSNPTKELWVPLALTDRALLSSILCSVDQFRAKMSGQKEPPSALNHLKQTIQILNERLQRPLQGISDSTIAAVAGLALAEQSSGNQANWRVHIRGIKQMVEIRGGLSAFESNPILHDKLCRADICGSVYDLSKPYLHIMSGRVQSSIHQGQNETERTLTPGFQDVHVNYRFNSDLYDILYRVHTLTQDINTIKPPKSEVIPLRIRERIRSVQYYFLYRGNYDESNGSGTQLLQACRIGVLLYLGIIQNDFWVSPINKQLIWQLKHCLDGEIFTADYLRPLRLWLSFLAGSLILEPTEKSWCVCFIAQAIPQLSLSNWYDAKFVLETFAWAGRVQDGPGRALWNQVVKMQSDS